MAANPYAQYRKSQVETADQGTLLLMLYDGALRFLGRAMKSLNEGDLEGANTNLLRVQDIVFELWASLNLKAGGDIAASLSSLYEYIYHLLVQANIKKDIEPLYQVEKMLVELKGAWKQSLEGTPVSGSKGKQIKKPFQVNGQSEKDGGAASPFAKSVPGSFEPLEAVSQGEKAAQKGSSKLNIIG